MQIYDFSAPREFIQRWLKEQPKAGRGLLRAWSTRFKVHPTLLSQVLNGKRLLTPELAHQMAEAMALSEGETDFLLLLVQLEQAGNQSLKKRFTKKIEEAKSRARLLSSRVQPEKEWNETAKSTFYSSWIYSAVRNLTAIPQFQTVPAIAQKLGVSRDLVQATVAFLLEQELCKMQEGRIEVGQRRTYVSADSPLVQPHHQNWRMHALSKIPLKRESDFFLTVPMSLSQDDSERVRSLLLKAFEEINKIIGPSPSETTRCLNIDYFDF